MSNMGTPTSRKGNMLVQKMYQLDAAYREIDEKDRELVKYRMSNSSRSEQQDKDQEKEREIIRLKYMVAKLDERLQIAKVECENAKRALKDEQEGRKIVDKKLKALDKENKEMRNKMSGLRAKLGVVNANHNVIKHETGEMRKTNQENQIQIARLEERLAAANQERERLKNPMNPEGSEEVRTRLAVENKAIKKLKAKIEKLKNQIELEQQNLDNKEEENRMLATELNISRQTIANLETSLEMAEMTIEAEKASREDFENQNRKLRSEKAGYDDQIKQYKIKLGISNASKNVNIRQTEVLRKKDDEYQFIIQTIEKKLRVANAEIERLKTRYEMTGKTADSLLDHRTRIKKYRNVFGAENNSKEQVDQPGIKGWSPTRATQQDRISMNSLGSVSSRKSGPTKLKINSGKGGRTSVP